MFWILQTTDRYCKWLTGNNLTNYGRGTEDGVSIHSHDGSNLINAATRIKGLELHGVVA